METYSSPHSTVTSQLHDVKKCQEGIALELTINQGKKGGIV